MTKKKKLDNKESEMIILPTNFREVTNLTNGVLNSLLRQFGLSTKGKRNHKITLLASQLNIPTTGSETGDPFVQTLKQVKNLKDGWTTNIRLVPEIKLQDISDYLIAAHDITVQVENGVYEQFSRETMSRYKALRSYDLWESGHIGNIRFNPLENIESFCAVKSDANPSGDTSGTQYNVVIILNCDGGKPVGASCTCVAGLGEACTHVAGLLFAIEDFVSRGFKDLPDDLATTEKLCKWIVPKGTVVDPKPINDVDVVKPSHGKQKKEKLYNASKYNPVPENKRDVIYDDLVTLKQTLSLHYPNIPWLSSVAPAMMEKYRPETEAKPDVKGVVSMPEVVVIEDPALVPAYEVTVTTTTEPLTAVEKAKLFVSAKKTIDSVDGTSKQFTDSLNWTEKDCDKIQELTLDQATSPYWMLYRKGLITASNFQRVSSRVNVMKKSKTDQTTANTRLVNDLVHGNNFKGNISTEYGKKMERKAVSAYQSKMKNEHKNFAVSKCGLFVHKKHGFLGASPDGISNCSCHQKTLVEVKCPKSIEKGGNLQKLDYMTKTSTGQYILKESSQGYYAQVQGQMAITGIHKCHFVVYNGVEATVTTVEFDQEYWNVLYEKLYFFYYTCISPALLEIQISKPACSDDINPLCKAIMSEVCEATKRYPCGSCGKELIESENLLKDTDASVACDCDCKCNLWFHWKCVNFNDTEEDEFEEELKWFCPGCVRNCDVIY